MEIYVYYSIVLFSLIIFFLYIYIITEKIIDTYKHKKKQHYSKEIIPFLEDMINELIDLKIVEEYKMERLKIYCKNKEKRELIIDTLIYYFEIFKGEFTPQMAELCEAIGIVDYEIKNLKTTNVYKKALACKRLGEFRSKKALPYLLKEVNTLSVDILYNVFLSLAKIGDEKAFIEGFERLDKGMLLSERSLIEIVDSFEGNKRKVYNYMINSKDDFITSVFIKSAGNFRDYSLSEDISRFLRENNKEKKIAAIKAIGGIGDNRYSNDIIYLLKDEDWEVRAIAAKALGKLGEDKAISPLLEALSDRQWFVRYNAASSLLAIDKTMESLVYVFEGKDKFAKDIIISSLESTGLIAKLSSFKDSKDETKRRIALLIYNYIEENNKDEENE